MANYDSTVGLTLRLQRGWEFLPCILLIVIFVARGSLRIPDVCLLSSHSCKFSNKISQKVHPSWICTSKTKCQWYCLRSRLRILHINLQHTFTYIHTNARSNWTVVGVIIDQTAMWEIQDGGQSWSLRGHHFKLSTSCFVDQHHN
jgi:hypothetical protein